jgi:tetratricopeptide (TPR) repeat protein
MHYVSTSRTFDSTESQPHQPSSSNSTSSSDASGQPNYGSSFGVQGMKNPIVNPGLSEKQEKLNRLREKGKASYNEKAYRQSIEFITEGIQLFLQSSGQTPSRGVLGILFSNRAAALMMVGAFEAAAEDCRSALEIASDPSTIFESSDASPLLKPRLHARLARAFLRLGRVDDADREFAKATQLSSKLALCVTTMRDEEYLSRLDQVTTDCTLGESDLNRLREKLAKLANFNEQSVNPRRVLERNATIDALSEVTEALSIATGCLDLHQMKVKLLADLKRWREVASHAERLAAGRVSFDGCFVGDLASKNPIPTSTEAKYLRTDYFDNSKENDLEECQKTLTTTAAREAVLRLPFPMIPLYIRSLRLEERYAAAEVCLLTLEQFVTENVGGTGREELRSSFSWLPREKDKLIRTKAEREKGDEFYQYAQYDKAAEKYAACLLIDFEGSQFSDGVGAGGRLHAVLHCNRAACLMALKRYHEALTECTAALRIHSRYMKAILRRARCYSRLERYEEATDEYARWLEMVRQARADPNSFSSNISPCIMEGPDTINAKEENAVKQELDDLLKSRAQAQAAERSRAAYEQQRAQWQSDRFNSSYTARNTDAQRRREYFQSHQSASRRWDSFADRGPNSSRSAKTNPRPENVNASQSQSERTTKTVRSPKEYAENDSHYDVLQISINASVSDVKKAYRTMARIYHPDKNSDPGAVDSFRRIQLAHDVLTNPESRRKHDSDLRWRRR